MVENRPYLTVIRHVVLILGVAIIAFPLYVAFVGSTQTSREVVQVPMSLLPGTHFLDNYAAVLGGHGSHAPPVARMLWISAFMAVAIAVGKIVVSLLSAFAVVYFRFRFRMLCFWLIFVTLMLPVEVRIAPTYAVVADLHMLNSYAGLTLPLIASATATFLFRQFFLTVPDSLAEAARVDGASPLRFFWDILVPLSRTSVAALFVIEFIYGWNQYLWPLMIATHQDMYPIVIGIQRMIAGGDSVTQWNLVMATAVLAMVPPALVVILMQRWFVKGLLNTEK